MLIDWFQQCIPSDGFPRTRPESPTRRDARALPSFGDQDRLATGGWGTRIPTFTVDHASRPQDLQSINEQPWRTQNRRLWHGPLLRRSTSQADPAGCDTLVPSAGAAPRRRQVRHGDRHVEHWLYLWRAAHQRASLTRQERSRPGVQDLRVDGATEL
jgi:hypothetical protein